MNKEEIIVDARFLKKEEVISSGSIVDFACHRAFLREVVSFHPTVNPSPQQGVISAPSLNFQRGICFASSVRSSFGHPVNFSEGPGRREFLLVVGFGRAKFRLDVHTVAIALQSCFGGHAGKFRVRHLKERSFRFSVASKSVGFQIYNARSICEDDFECHFNLWGNGGPNWLIEESNYYKELDAEWSKVSRSKKSVFDRLQFVQEIQERDQRPSVFTRLISQDITTKQVGILGIQNGVNRRDSRSFAKVAASAPRAQATRQMGCINSALPGLLSMMTFPSFKAPDPANWADGSVQTWFRQFGPALPVVTANSFAKVHLPSLGPASSASPDRSVFPNPASILESLVNLLHRCQW